MTVLPFFENLDFLKFHNMHVFHCYDLEKKTINTNTFSFHYMCVSIIISFIIYLYIFCLFSLYFCNLLSKFFILK